MGNKQCQSNHNLDLQAFVENKCIVNRAVINVPIFENLLVEAKRKSHSKCPFFLLLTKDNFYPCSIYNCVF